MNKPQITWIDRTLAASMFGLAVGILIGTIVAISVWHPIEPGQPNLLAGDGWSSPVPRH